MRTSLSSLSPCGSDPGGLRVKGLWGSGRVCGVMLARIFICGWHLSAFREASNYNMKITK